MGRRATTQDGAGDAGAAPDDGASTHRWRLVADPVTVDRRRAWEAMMTLSDGTFGTRGLGQSCGSPSWPAVVAAGVYDDSIDVALVGGPLWATTELEPGDCWSETAELDLHDAVLTSHFRDERSGAMVTSTRFASASRQGVMALRLDGPRGHLADCPPLQPPPGSPVGVDVAVDGDRTTHDEIRVTCPTGAIGATARQWVVDDGDDRTLTRIAVYRAEQGPRVDLEDAHAALDAAATVGFDRLAAEHRAVWRRRWERAVTGIAGAADLDLAVKFAEYHLLASASEHDDEAAIGARGLTGPGYHGHVFWDTEVFVVPALSAMSPRAARAALMYRWNRLGAARERARRAGRSGARFPWESAADGRDVTPRAATDLHGATVEILTGDLEEHIVADVAWSVVRYVEWTGDHEFMARVGGPMLVETARYWASRLDLDPDDSAHVRGVIGPDEYHVRVDDNAFTNVMARYNLRVAAEHGDRHGLASADERRRWRDLADRIVDGLDPATGVYEQFDGFHRLAPTLVGSVGTPPLNADIVLGHDAIRGSQIIKQPDVLMLHHMVPGEVAPGSLDANLDVYIPRTAHGSSLSPAICAGLLAAAGRLDEAAHLFELSARLDLDPITGATTMGGVHLAAMGGVWQALTHGFLGVRLTARGLDLDPRLPAQWGAVGHRFEYQRTPVRIEVDGDCLSVTAVEALDVGVGGRDVASGRAHEFRRSADGWERR